MKNPTQITVTLSVDMVNKLKKDASKLEISYASYLRMIINDYYKNENRYRQIIELLEQINNKI